MIYEEEEDRESPGLVTESRQDAVFPHLYHYPERWWTLNTDVSIMTP